MSEQEAVTPQFQEPESGVATQTETSQASDTSRDDDGGKGGKKALLEDLARERDKRQAAERQLQEFQEMQNKTAAERAEIEKQRELERAALAKANERILKAEVRAAAADKLVNPADALHFIDLSTFEVGDDGSVDADAIGAAIDDLLSTRSYLAKSRDAAKVQGSADGGTREASRPRQLTRADLARMSVHDIEQARQEGRLDSLLSGKT